MEDWERFKIFFYQGGQNNMRGAYQGPIEVGLDFWSKYSDEDFGKIFFIVNKKWDTFYEGTVDSFSIVDYRWNEEFELACAETNIAIVNHGETVLSVDYDLIVPGDDQAITQNTNLSSNMVSRFSPTVGNNAILTIEEGVKIDMYDSEITINAGSELIMEDNSIIVAKKGNCKIIIDGEITIDDNVSFKAEDGATLEIILRNTSNNITFDNTAFENCKLNNHSNTLTITDCSFTGCKTLYSHRGSVTFTSTDFDDSYWYLEDQTSGQSNTISISNCDFTYNYIQNPNPTATAIDTWNYGNFNISNQ